jgi:peptidoglycan/LPS O-acetylase OafA/YrhL
VLAGLLKMGWAACMQILWRYFLSYIYIYITHYPIIYTYTAWVKDNNKTFAEAWPVGLLVFVSSVLLAYVALKLYDEPVRKWLAAKMWAKKA